MTQQEKELLLEDLSARLPYGVIVHTTVDGGGTVLGVYKDRVFTTCEEYNKHNDYPVECVKPYLRPMSSITEEEKKELGHSCKYIGFNGNIVTYGDEMCYTWLNAHHFDYRGLIEKGLALEAPEGMYKTE